MKKKVMIIIAIAIGIILLSLIVFLVLNKNIINFSDISQYEDPLTTNCITIKNENDLYAIFNVETGKKLTDFKFKKVGKFIDGSAIVENKNGEMGIIDNKGKMLADFGKYYLIFREGGLFQVSNSEESKKAVEDSYLINSKGKIICTLVDSEKDIKKDITGDDYITIVISDGKANILDYKGNSMLKIDCDMEADEKDFHTYRNNNYDVLSYNGVAYIFDIYDRKYITKIDITDGVESYGVYSIKDNNSKEYVISNKMFSYLSNETEEYIFMNGSNMSFRRNDIDELYFDGNNLICKEDYNKNYIVDENGEHKIEVDQYGGNAIDFDNYIKLSENSKNTEFYVDGKLFKTVENKGIYGYTSQKQKIYILINDNKTYSYYNYKGEKLFDSEYEYAGKFNKNDIANVKDINGEFLINVKGERVSEYYESIEIYECENKKIVYLAKRGNTQCILNESGKEVLSSENKIEIEKKNNYVILYNEEDSIDSLYTLDGKIIYKY